MYTELIRPTDHMEIMPAFAGYYVMISSVKVGNEEQKPTQTTIIPWIFACRTSAIEMYLTDTAYIVVWDIPTPCSYCIPLADLDLHCGAVDYPSIQFELMWVPGGGDSSLSRNRAVDICGSCHSRVDVSWDLQGSYRFHVSAGSLSANIAVQPTQFPNEPLFLSHTSGFAFRN
jgi:hypothetical protein